MDEIKDSTSNWKPIETAPKDGSDILILYRHVSGDRYIVIGSYQRWSDLSAVDPHWERDNDGGRLEDWAVTHWMNLPDVPPEEELPK